MREKGISLLESVKKAGVSRFRPVLLTSLTIFFGLTPLTFVGKTSTVFLQPMAVSLSFGILFATVITLFFIPINMMITHDIKQLLTDIYGNKNIPEQEPNN